MNETLSREDGPPVPLSIDDCLSETSGGSKHNAFWAFLSTTLLGTALLTCREVRKRKGGGGRSFLVG